MVLGVVEVEWWCGGASQVLLQLGLGPPFQGPFFHSLVASPWAMAAAIQSSTLSPCFWRRHGTSRVRDEIESDDVGGGGGGGYIAACSRHTTISSSSSSLCLHHHHHLFFFLRRLPAEPRCWLSLPPCPSRSLLLRNSRIYCVKIAC